MNEAINTKWTPEMKAYVSELYGVGNKSTRDIARLVNKKFGTCFSRNAVIGVTNRAGLKRLPMRSRTPSIDTITTIRAIKKKTVRTVPAPPREKKPAQGGPMNNPEFKARHGAEKKLIDTLKDECLFPIDTDEGVLFCSKKKADGISYCDHHAALCFEPKEVVAGA